MVNVVMIELLFGTIAFATSIIGLLPQIYKVMKTRSTDDISMLMLINYFCSSVAWLIYGLCIHSMFVVTSNIFGLLSSFFLILQKRLYDKKNNESSLSMVHID
jgi:MtN3 and saliva related transmembrane protein